MRGEEGGSKNGNGLQLIQQQSSAACDGGQAERAEIYSHPIELPPITSDRITAMGTSTTAPMLIIAGYRVGEEGGV